LKSEELGCEFISLFSESRESLFISLIIIFDLEKSKTGIFFIGYNSISNLKLLEKADWSEL
jgi:hypothetical protein